MKRKLKEYLIFYFIFCINPNSIFNSLLFTFFDQFFPYLITEGSDGRTDGETRIFLYYTSQNWLILCWFENKVE